MTTLIELILNKLGLNEEIKLQSKTTELMRLLEIRGTSLPAQINDYGKIVLCADIAASLLSVEFDKEQALKLANLRKTQYANFKRLFEKLLEVNRLVGIKEICIQLGLSSGITQKAVDLLALYEKIIAAEDADVDIKHPQYAAMAVFQACKMLKQKIVKPKIMSFSHLRPTQWTMLEQRWDKFLTQYYHQNGDGKTFKTNENVSDKSAENIKKDDEKVGGKRQKPNETEDYELWKKRMLDMANAKLKLLNMEMEKENI